MATARALFVGRPLKIMIVLVISGAALSPFPVSFISVSELTSVRCFPVFLIALVLLCTVSCVFVCVHPVVCLAHLDRNPALYLLTMHRLD